LRRKRLNFKQRDFITGELKNVGYVEMRNADDDPDEETEDAEQEEETEEPDEPEEEPDEPAAFPPKSDDPEENPDEEPDEETVDLYFYGDIGGAAWETADFEEDKCPQDVQDFFNSIPDNAAVNIYMNSGGGDAYAGLAIANMIRRHKGKTTGHVDGLAASIASVIVSGCDRVVIHTGGQFMVHKPLTIAWGNANDFKDAIKRLDACQDCITDIYMTKAKAGVTRDQITKLVNAETWLGATTAQRYFNFETDSSTAAVAAKSSYYATYKHVPQNIGRKPATKDTNDIVAAVIAALDDREARKAAAETEELQGILDSLENYGA
jgi:ATP-dependent protease ClpP protease subunit